MVIAKSVFSWLYRWRHGSRKVVAFGLSERSVSCVDREHVCRISGSNRHMLSVSRWNYAQMFGPLCFSVFSCSFWWCVFLSSVCGVFDELSKCQCEPFPIESCDCVLSPVFISSGNIPHESFIFFWIQEMTGKKYCSGRMVWFDKKMLHVHHRFSWWWLQSPWFRGCIAADMDLEKL